MVWDPPKETVNVNRMIIYSFIPLLAIYAGWRIQKFWVLLGINFGLGYLVGIPVQMVLPYPWGYGLSLLIVIIASVFIVRHFARKYNERISSEIK